jgi:hypothetical protein
MLSERFMAISFATDIRPLFRQEDIVSMKNFGFDLSSHADVSARADGIFAQFKSGAMPCDGAWIPGEYSIVCRLGRRRETAVNGEERPQGCADQMTASP